MDLRDTDALVVVDVQNDFCPGGALAVERGDEVVPVVNALMPRFRHVLGTLDWHPPDHSSFREFGGPWPVHCVQGTKGAQTHPDLDSERVQHFTKKGWRVDVDGYSGFVEPDLEQQLRGRGISRVFFAGLATDYCVRYTSLHALERGFETVVVTDACRPVNVEPGDERRALDEIVAAGGILATSDSIHS